MFTCCAGSPGFEEFDDVVFGVVGGFLDAAGIDHGDDVFDCDGGFGDVGCCDDFAEPAGGGGEDAALFVGEEGGVEWEGVEAVGAVREVFYCFETSGDF